MDSRTHLLQWMLIEPTRNVCCWIDENGAHYILSVIFSADKKADLFHKLTTTKSSFFRCPALCYSKILVSSSTHKRLISRTTLLQPIKLDDKVMGDACQFRH